MVPFSRAITASTTIGSLLAVVHTKPDAHCESNREATLYRGCVFLKAEEGDFYWIHGRGRGPPGCEAETGAAGILPSREAVELSYFPSTLNLLSTENTPLTVFARIPAMSLSPCDATTPTSTTCPFATMMWIGGTACSA